MAVLSWGNPTIEYVKLEDGAIPSSPTWTPISAKIKEDSTQLITNKGTKNEAFAEGGDIVDVRYSKNTYTLEFEIYLSKGQSLPIEHTDGVVSEEYAVRLIPEDATIPGFVLSKTRVSVENTWTSKDGELAKYNFDALKPTTGNMLQSFTKPSGD